MNRLRLLPLSRLIALAVAVVAILAAGTAIAMGALSGAGSKPPAKPLAQALHDAAAAPAVDGVTARISFTNHLIDSGSLSGAGGNPLITGASGRLWASNDGRFRLELQSDQGDAQVVGDGKTITVYDGTSNTAYVVTPPPHKDSAGSKPSGPPSVAKIEQALKDLARTANVSGAQPSNVAGREAYTVTLSPRHDGGLVGSAQLAWDAANGTPLRAAVYASGNPKPVLELQATDISFGKVAGSDLSASPPAGAKVQKVDLSGHDAAAGGAAKDAKPVTGVKAVSAALPFALKAPDTLVGLPRHEVRLITMGSDKGALVTYGAGLGGVAVLQTPAKPAGQPAQQAPRGDRKGLSLPKVSIDGTSAEELSTALGTVVRFERGGVQYVIVGSVTPQAAEAAARGL
jgi:outer membrane lipoprotein-sorting protein